MITFETLKNAKTVYTAGQKFDSSSSATDDDADEAQNGEAQHRMALANTIGLGDEFWIDLKTTELQFYPWQQFCRTLASSRICLLDLRDTGMGAQAMRVLKDDVLSTRCTFSECIEELRLDSTGSRTYGVGESMSMTSDGIAAQRKDFTLDKVKAELDFSGKDLGEADIRIIAAWMTLDRPEPVEKLTFDTTGVSRWDGWRPSCVTLNAKDSHIDLVGKHAGAADVELLADWI